MQKRTLYFLVTTSCFLYLAVDFTVGSMGSKPDELLTTLSLTEKSSPTEKNTYFSSRAKTFHVWFKTHTGFTFSLHEVSVRGKMREEALAFLSQMRAHIDQLESSSSGRVPASEKKAVSELVEHFNQLASVVLY